MELYKVTPKGFAKIDAVRRGETTLYEDKILADYLYHINRDPIFYRSRSGSLPSIQCDRTRFLAEGYIELKEEVILSNFWKAHSTPSEIDPDDVPIVDYKISKAGVALLRSVVSGPITTPKTASLFRWLEAFSLNPDKVETNILKVLAEEGLLDEVPFLDEDDILG